MVLGGIKVFFLKKKKNRTKPNRPDGWVTVEQLRWNNIGDSTQIQNFHCSGSSPVHTINQYSAGVCVYLEVCML